MNSATSFNIIDLVALIVVVLGAVIGFKRGLIGQVVPVLGFCVVALTAGFGYSPCFDWLARATTWSSPGVWVVTLLLVVAIPLIIVILLGRRLIKLAQSPLLAKLDHAAGTLTGLGGGLLAVVLVLLVLTELPGPYRPDAFVKGSWTGRRVIAGKEQSIGIVTQKLENARDELLWSRKHQKPKDTHEGWER